MSPKSQNTYISKSTDIKETTVFATKIFRNRQCLNDLRDLTYDFGFFEYFSF